MAIPLIIDDETNRASGAVDRFGASTLIWSDEFGGTEIKADRWGQPQFTRDINGQNFQRRLWQTNVTGHDNEGNVYLDENGNPEYDFAPEGKRHAIWYNGPKDANGNADRSQVQYVQGGKLVLGGKATSERDPTIDTTSINPAIGEVYHPYYDDRGPDAGVVDLRHKIYGSWLQGADAIEDVDNFNEKIIDPRSPKQIFRYGFYQFAIDFSQMQRGDAYRVSAWLMPMCSPTTPNLYANGAVYDRNPTTGCEVDLFEHENAHGGRNSDLLLMKSIDGADKSYWERTFGSLDNFAPGTEATVATAVGPGFNLREGVHVIGLWWSPTAMRYYLNGYEANVDLQRIPKIGQAFFWTREGNTCLNYNSGPTPYPPQRQRENGYLYGDNIGKNPSLINSDKVFVDYLRIWQDPSLNGDASDPDTNWRSPETFGKIDPTTPGADEAGEGNPGLTGANTGGGTDTGGGTTTPVTGPDRTLDYTVHYDPITAPGVPANLSLRIKSFPANTRVRVNWTHDAGAAAEIDDPTALSTTITLLEDATRLIDVQPNVSLESTLPNQPPVADAGDDVTADIDEVVTLPVNGQSTDPDGTIAAWSWTSASGTVLGTESTLRVSLPSAGSSPITLTVTDDEGLSSSDTMVLTARPDVVELGVPTITSLTATSSSTLDMQHTTVPDATGYSTQVLGSGGQWVDLGYHVGAERVIEGGTAGAERQVRMRAEDRSESPVRVSDWSALATGTTSAAPTGSADIDVSMTAAAPENGYVRVTVSWTDSFSGSRDYAVGVDTSQPTNDPPDAQRNGVFGASGPAKSYTFSTRADGRTLLAMVVGQSIDPLPPEWRGGSRAGRYDISPGLTLPVQAVPVGQGATNGEQHNGIGQITSTSGYETINVGNGPYVVSGNNTVFEKKIIIQSPGHEGKNTVLQISGGSNITVRDIVVWVPKSYTQYRDAYSMRTIYVDQSAPNCTIERVNTFGGAGGVVANRADGLHVTDSVFARPGRHAVIFDQCDPTSERNCYLARCYGYGDPARPDGYDSPSGSTDGFNFYSMGEPSSGKHIMEDVLWENGRGLNGSCFIIDGYDRSLTMGGQTIRRCTGINGGNKLTAIAGGRNNLIEDCDGWQSSSHPARFFSSGGVSAYIFDFRSANNPRARDFRNNVLRRVRTLWFLNERNGTGRGGGSGHVGFGAKETSDKSYAYGWPADRATFDDCDEIANGLSGETIRNTAITRLGGAIPAYVVNGERMMGLENEV